MPTQSRIRLATIADGSALARLRYQFRASLEPATENASQFVARCTGWMTERLAPGGGWRCWVVQSGTAIQGNLWLQIIEKLPNPVGEPDRHGYVSNLYVEPALRGQGLGSALLEECLRECERQGVDAVILWPTPQSRSLYQRHGFAVRDDLMERRRR